LRPWERWLLHLGVASAVLSGAAYGYLRYFKKVQGEFGIEPHPWQGLLQHAHVLTAPLLVLAVGVALRGHGLGMLKQGLRPGRWTGLCLLFLSAPMILSGYAIQVVTESSTHRALAWVHGASWGAFLLSYATHSVVAWTRAARAALRASSGGGIVGGAPWIERVRFGLREVFRRRHAT
jgi:hypothetical protein